MHVHSSQIKKSIKICLSFSYACRMKRVPTDGNVKLKKKERKSWIFFPNLASSGGTCKIAKLLFTFTDNNFWGPKFAMVQRNNNSTHKRAVFSPCKQHSCPIHPQVTLSCFTATYTEHCKLKCPNCNIEMCNKLEKYVCKLIE
jgi:hypothetical protein